MTVKVEQLTGGYGKRPVIKDLTSAIKANKSNDFAFV
jgi:ABC-type cobalamin/Fe3+-siderophores transport system ATPase subunit